MEIMPIQITVVNFPVYVKICQDNLGYSPTRGLDDAGIDIKLPAAFLYTLDFDNQPRKAIQQSELYHHAFASFMGVLDSATLCMMCRIFCIKITSKPLKQGKELAVFSGTISEWNHIITGYTFSRWPKDIREFLNIVKRNLERAGYSPIWTNYDELPQADGTFTLRHR